MIHIDFYPGSHGNYLEFVCNKIAGITVGVPFNSKGASHSKKYIKRKIFHAHHYSFWSKPFKFDKIIKIQVNHADWLQLRQISLLRGGDIGYDNNLLEIDTYNKLNKYKNFHPLLDNIIQGFFANQIKNSYDAVKDPLWPDVITLNDFKNLPDWIKKECVEQHGIVLLELTPDNPNCPRSILREFFQIGFQTPEQDPTLLLYQKQIKSDQTYTFPFQCFYHKSNFLQEIEKIALWANIPYNCQQDIAELHDEFLKRQPYIHSKSRCDNIVYQIQNNKIVDLPKTDMLEEAYINAKLGWDYFV
jgi:hypothetical protein